jgi:hypothetical protein
MHLSYQEKNSEHSRKYERHKRQRTGEGGTKNGKHRKKRQEHWNRATEKETLGPGQLIGLRGGKSRIGDGTDHLRQGTKEDERLGTET